METNDGSLTVTATGYEFDSLESNDGGIVLGAGTLVEFDSLTDSSASITATTIDTFTAISLATTTGTISTDDGSTIAIANLSTTTLLAQFATLDELQLHSQSDTVDFSGAVSMTTLTVLGKKNTPIVAGGQQNDVVITRLTVNWNLLP